MWAMLKNKIKNTVLIKYGEKHTMKRLLPPSVLEADRIIKFFLCYMNNIKYTAVSYNEVYRKIYYLS